MNIHNIQKTRSLPTSIRQSAVSLAPLFSQKIRPTRSPPFSLVIQNKNENLTKNKCFSIFSGDDKNKQNTKESFEIAPRKYSLGGFQKEIGLLPEFKKQVGFDRQTIRRSTKSSLGHIIRRSNGLLPHQHRTVSKESNPLGQIETLESIINNSTDKKQLSKGHSSSFKNVKKLVHVSKTKRSSTYKIRPTTKINELKQNQLKGYQNDEKKNVAQIERISVCLAKGNHLSLRQKLKNKQALNSQQKNKNLLECLQGMNISLSKDLANDIQSESFGLGQSVIEIKNVTNDSSFIQEEDRELLDQLQVNRQRGQSKRGWRKLPSDFLKAT